MGGKGVLVSALLRVDLQAERDGLAALSELFFGPRETSDVLVRDQVGAVTEPDVFTPARSVADRGDDLVGLVELGDRARKPGWVTIPVTRASSVSLLEPLTVCSGQVICHTSSTWLAATKRYGLGGIVAVVLPIRTSERRSPRMIRTVLTLRVAPERVAEVVEMYKQQDILQRSLDLTEALRSELSVATDGSGVVMVTAVWPSVEAYQAWLDNPWRRESSDRLDTLLNGASVGSGAIFSISQSVSKE